MKIVSIQVGLPKTVEFKGRQVTTGIFKSPVVGPVFIGTTNLHGDRQADLSVHGGPDKAVYGYSLDAYPWWKNERPKDEFPYGAFGENLSIDSLPENSIFVGDTYEVGSAILQAVQPRFPCYKLGVKFNDMSVVKTFMRSERPGVYFRVLQEGLLSRNEDFKLIDQDPTRISILKLFSIFHQSEIDRADLEEILQNKALATEMRAQFSEVLKRL